MKNFSLLLVFAFTFISCGKKEDYTLHEMPRKPLVLPAQQFINQNVPIISIAEDKKIDVLWVIDNSGSMSGIQHNIITNSAIFMDSFKNHKFLEWKMGLMSTDKDENPYLGFAIPFDFQSPDPVSTFQNAVNSLGTNGDPFEYLFYNIQRAKTSVLLQDFFRPEAHLAVIMVTDEEEQSEKDHGAQFEALTFINSIKGTMAPDKVLRFYGAFEMQDLTACPTGSFNPYYKGSPLETVINETGGMVISACIPDFGTALAEIGKDIVSLLKKPSILLDKRPKVETIEVRYEGKLLSGGPRDQGGIWYYDYYFNTIRFYTLDFAPDLNTADVNIRFEINDGLDRNP